MFWITEEGKAIVEAKFTNFYKKCIISFYLIFNIWGKKRSVFFFFILLSWNEEAERPDLSEMKWNVLLVLLVIILLSAHDISDLTRNIQDYFDDGVDRLIVW